MENQKNTTCVDPMNGLGDFRCIDCQGRLKTTDAGMACECGREYPFVDGCFGCDAQSMRAASASMG